MSHSNPETLLFYGPIEEVKESNQVKRKASPTKKTLNQDIQLNIKETLNSMFAQIEWEENGRKFVQSVSPKEATREKAKELFKALDEKLKERNAREKGICPIREEIYSQCFDEIIRKVKTECPERGLLLLRVRDEIKMTIASYQQLYEASTLFGIRKQLQAENEKNEIEKKRDELFRKRIELSNEKKKLVNEAEGLKRQINERNEIEKEKREHDTTFIKDELSHLQTLLDSIGKK